MTDEKLTKYIKETIEEYKSISVDNNRDRLIAEAEILENLVNKIGLDAAKSAWEYVVTS